MARFRLSLLARADLAQILATSVEHWGIEGRRRYAALLAAGMRKVAFEPDGPATRHRLELSRGIRSFHLRNARADNTETKVRKPVHVLFYRVINREWSRSLGSCTSAWSRLGMSVRTRRQDRSKIRNGEDWSRGYLRAR
jgi:toxin ParE1/3/4